MTRADSDLAPARVTALLRSDRLGRDYRLLDACGSTNDEALILARQGAPEGLVVVAETQHQGRGRLGRVWHSPPGENLYLSILLRPTCVPTALPPVTLIAGTALARVVAQTGLRPRVKWPNDLLLPIENTYGKTAGILTEMASDRDHIRHVIVGVGININGMSFPETLATKATSLRLATGQVQNRAQILSDFLWTFERALDAAFLCGTDVALDEWRSFADLPQRCQFERDGLRVTGTAINLDSEGGLLVREAQGQVTRVMSGEVLAL